MKLNIKATVPLIAVYKGLLALDGGNQINHHMDPRTYQYCGTPLELEAAKNHPSIMGFRLPSSKVPSQFGKPLEVQVDTANAVPVPPPLIRACLIGTKSAEWLIKNGWADRNEIEVWYLGASRPRIRHTRWIPCSNNLTLPIINGGEFFDIVIGELPSWGSNLDEMDKILRQGGIFVALAEKQDFEAHNYRLSARYDHVYIGGEENSLVSTNDGQGYSYVTDTKGLTFYGIKKTTRQPDPETSTYIGLVTARKGIYSSNNSIFASGLLPLSYPPAETFRVLREKVYDDAKLPADKPVDIAFIAPKTGNSRKEYDEIDKVLDGLRAFARLKASWTDSSTSYRMELLNPGLIPEIRTYVGSHFGWEMKIKGQRGKEVVTGVSIPVETSIYTPCRNNPPSFVPNEMEPSFINSHFGTTTPELVSKDEEKQAAQTELVFPIEPGIANLMKLFGKLRPSVVKDDDGIHHLVGGSIESIEDTMSVPGPEGHPITTITTRKRAKLILLPMNGPELGDYYEAEMG